MNSTVPNPAIKRFPSPILLYWQVVPGLRKLQKMPVIIFGRMILRMICQVFAPRLCADSVSVLTGMADRLLEMGRYREGIEKLTLAPISRKVIEK